MPDFSTTDYLLQSDLTVVRIPDFDETACNNVTGAAPNIWSFSIDNSANAAASSYAKFYAATSATVGTTAPNMVIPVAAGEVIEAVFVTGLALSTGLSLACVTAGGTAGTTGPTSPVVGTFAVSA